MAFDRVENDQVDSFIALAYVTTNKTCLVNSIFFLVRPHSITSMLTTDPFLYHHTPSATNMHIQFTKVGLPKFTNVSMSVC